jgi:hypothetical protein
MLLDPDTHSQDGSGSIPHGYTQIRIRIQIRNSKEYTLFNTWSARLYCSLWRRQRHLSDSISILSGSMLKVKKKLSLQYSSVKSYITCCFDFLQVLVESNVTNNQSIRKPMLWISIFLGLPDPDPSLFCILLSISNLDFSHFFTSFFTYYL